MDQLGYIFRMAPKSLTELNERLRSCDFARMEDLGIICNASVVHSISLEDLFSCIVRQAYSDGNFESAKANLKMQLFRIYPLDKAPDKDKWKKIFKRINQEITPTAIEQGPRDQIGKVEATDAIRNQIETIQPDKMVQRFIVEISKNGLQRAGIVQTGLTLLNYEQKLLQQAYLWATSELQTASYRSVYLAEPSLVQDATQVNPDIAVFAIPKDVPDSRVFSFLLFGSAEVMREKGLQIDKAVFGSQKKVSPGLKAILKQLDELNRVGLGDECLLFLKYLHVEIAQTYTTKAYADLGSYVVNPARFWWEYGKAGLTPFGDQLLILCEEHARVKKRILPQHLRLRERCDLKLADAVVSICDLYQRSFARRIQVYQLFDQRISSMKKSDQLLAKKHLTEHTEISIIPIEELYKKNPTPEDVLAQLTFQSLQAGLHIESARPMPDVVRVYKPKPPTRKKKTVQREFVVRENRVEEEKKQEAIRKPLEREVYPVCALRYDSRVVRWMHSPPGELLPIDRFPEYAEQSVIEHRRAIAYHGFPIEVDGCLEQHAITVQQVHHLTGESETLQILAAEIRFNGESRRGTIVYCIDRQGVCYHRYFQPVEHHGRLVQQLVFERFQKADFPELADAVKGEKNELIQKTPGIKIEQDPISHLIKIHDFRNQSVITIFERATSE